MLSEGCWVVLLGLIVGSGVVGNKLDGLVLGGPDPEVTGDLDDGEVLVSIVGKLCGEAESVGVGACIVSENSFTSVDIVSRNEGEKLGLGDGAVVGKGLVGSSEGA
jgi:hypothetical protein